MKKAPICVLGQRWPEWRRLVVLHTWLQPAPGRARAMSGRNTEALIPARQRGDAGHQMTDLVLLAGFLRRIAVMDQQAASAAVAAIERDNCGFYIEPSEVPS